MIFAASKSATVPIILTSLDDVGVQSNKKLWAMQRNENIFGLCLEKYSQKIFI